MALAAVLSLVLAMGPSAAFQQPLDPAGWRRIQLSGGSWSGPGYGIALPPGVQGGEIEGIDSAVAELRGAGIDMDFDYGPYGGYSGCEPRTGCSEIVETIDGRQARVAIAPRRISARIVVNGGLTVDLFARCATAVACRQAVRMVRTIRFSR